MNLDDYYSINEVLARIPFGTKAAFKKLVARGGFVPRLKIGNKWFFRKVDVHQFIEDHTHAGTPEEEERTWAELEQEARQRAKRKVTST